MLDDRQNNKVTTITNYYNPLAHARGGFQYFTHL